MLNPASPLLAPPPAGAGPTPRRSYLMATWDGGGHAGPLLSVARALLARGHRVRVLADPVLQTEVEASGATFVAWTAAPHNAGGAEPVDGGGRSPADAFRRVRDELICGPSAAFAADTRAELHREPADAVIADHMLPGVLVGAQAEGARTVALATTTPGVSDWGVPALGMGLTPGGGPVNRARAAVLAVAAKRLWRGGLPAFNAARAANGLAPISDPVDLVAGWDRLLILSSRAIEFDAFAPPAHVKLVGARTDDPAWAVRPWSPPVGNAPLVLVGLSSTNMDQQDVLARVVDALGTLPVRGLVTTGPAIDPAGFTPAPSVTVVRSAPHSVVLEHAAAVVTHGGHGTVAKTLAAGVPLLALPLGRDQHDVAARVVDRGAGLSLGHDAAPAEIAAAIQRLLADPSFAHAAAAAARVMADEGRDDRAVAELEALVTPA